MMRGRIILQSMQKNKRISYTLYQSYKTSLSPISPYISLRSPCPPGGLFNIFKSSSPFSSKATSTARPIVCTHLSNRPKIAENVYIAPTAIIQGHVNVLSFSSIWHHCVLRGDINSIHIGSRTNIQDMSCIHVASHLPVIIGNNVTVGHKATIHACTIKDFVLIGMGSIIMDGSQVDEYSIVGAGSLIPLGKKYPPYSLIMGSPAKRIRELTKEEIESIRKSADKYVQVQLEHQAHQAHLAEQP